MKQTFSAMLEAGGEGDAWTMLRMPFDVERTFGARGRVSVCGTINGFTYRSSIFPLGDGTHALMVNKAMQVGANARAGDRVHVEMEPALVLRAVEAPPDLADALGRNARARAAFAAMSYSKQKLLADEIQSAKKPETRAARVERAVERLAAAQPSTR